MIVDQIFSPINEEERPPDMAVRTDGEPTDTYGCFIAEPLLEGWGVTIGNSLRRVLLSGLESAAITWVRIESVLNEFSTLPYMKEDVMNFLLNVKGIRIKPNAKRPGRLRLDVAGEGEITAGDIMVTSDFEIVNPEHYLATLDSKDANLSVEFNVEHGVGYVQAKHNESLPLGTLPVDAIFAPVHKANFRVEKTRVGHRSDYERLIVEVWTDKTLSPLDAIKSASILLSQRFYVIGHLGEKTVDESHAMDIQSEVMNTPVESLDLSNRTLNSLKRSGLNRIGDVLQKQRNELMKIRNFGKKSLDELYEVLQERGYLPSKKEEGKNEDEEEEKEVE